MIRVTLALALTEVFNRSEHVLCNGFLVFNNLLNDNSFRETLLDTLWHNRFGSSVKQFLLAITKGVSLYVASVVCYTRIGLPVVVTGLLFTGAEVTVSLLIHLSGVSFFFPGAIEALCKKRTSTEKNIMLEGKAWLCNETYESLEWNAVFLNLELKFASNEGHILLNNLRHSQAK